jgi:hypothetical protein
VSFFLIALFNVTFIWKCFSYTPVLKHTSQWVFTRWTHTDRSRTSTYHQKAPPTPPSSNYPFPRLLMPRLTFPIFKFYASMCVSLHHALSCLNLLLSF